MFSLHGLFAAITAWRDDEWHETLSKLGFFLGKYIYILDAYDDLEKDVKKRIIICLFHI